MNYETNDRIITAILYSYSALRLHTDTDAHLKQLYIDIMQHTDLARSLLLYRLPFWCCNVICLLILTENNFFHSGDRLSWTHFARLYTILTGCTRYFVKDKHCQTQQQHRNYNKQNSKND